MVDQAASTRRVLLVTLFMNEAVAAMKLLWGIATGSLGMVSDGLHSLFDGVTNVLGLIGIWIAAHPPDREHPYGHRKFETLFTLLVSGLIFLTCFEILARAYRSFFEARRPEAGAESFAVMAVTIAVNIAVVVYEKRKAIELKSQILKADAEHTRSNVFSSIGVVAGLGFTALGYPIADSIAGLVVAAFIARIGYAILKEAASVLVDTVRMDTDEVCRVVLGVEGIRGCHKIRTRGTQHHVQLDLHVQLDPDMTLREAHKITHLVHKRLRAAFPEVSDIVVHTEPEHF